MILTDARGVPFERPEREDFETAEDFVRALQDYNAKVTRCANEAFEAAFRKELQMNRKKLEALVWKHTHRDFKGKREDGTKEVLHYLTNVGTCLVSLGSLTEEELIAKLPRSVRETLKDVL